MRGDYDAGLIGKQCSLVQKLVLYQLNASKMKQAASVRSRHILSWWLQRVEMGSSFVEDLAGNVPASVTAIRQLRTVLGFKLKIREVGNLPFQWRSKRCARTNKASEGFLGQTLCSKQALEVSSKLLQVILCLVRFILPSHHVLPTPLRLRPFLTQELTQSLYLFGQLLILRMKM